MPQLGTVETVALAVLGGVVLSFANVWFDYKKPIDQRASKDKLWYFFLVAWPVVGGILALVFTLEGPLRPILAFSIGLTAPTTVEAMMSKATSVPGIPVRAEE